MQKRSQRVMWKDGQLIIADEQVLTPKHTIKERDQYLQQLYKRKAQIINQIRLLKEEAQWINSAIQQLESEGSGPGRAKNRTSNPNLYGNGGSEEGGPDIVG